MQENEQEVFGELMTAMCEVHSKKLTTVILQLYWNAFERYEYVNVNRAFNMHLQNTDTGMFWPKPANILKILEGSSEDRAMLAWTKVINAVKSISCYETVVFDDPIIHSVIQDIGGWISLGEITSHEEPFKSNEFIKRYRGYVIRDPKKYPRKLLGLIEADTEQKNFPIPYPKLVGNQRNALDVYRHGVNPEKPKPISLDDALKRLPNPQTSGVDRKTDPLPLPQPEEA